MKNLETQVCTIEQAKRLEELLGEDVKSAFYWCDDGLGNCRIAAPCAKGFVTVDETGEVYTESGGEVYNAFTVAELGIMLPSEEYTQRTGTSVYNSWEWVNDVEQRSFGMFETEAQARAARLIYLLESGEETAEEVNQRLTL